MPVFWEECMSRVFIYQNNIAYGVNFGVWLLLKFDFQSINTILTIIFLNCFGDM